MFDTDTSTLSSILSGMIESSIMDLNMAAAAAYTNTLNKLRELTDIHSDDETMTLLDLGIWLVEAGVDALDEDEIDCYAIVYTVAYAFRVDS